MAQNYTRQSSFADGDTITASLFNNEYNQLVNTFTYSALDASATGHRHDGSAGQGGNIYIIGDLDFLNKIEVDSTNNRWGFYTEVSGVATEQIRIQDGAVVPVTDSDIDLGTTSLYFKNTYTDTVTTTGDVSVGGNLTVTGSATISGNLTFGDAATDTVSFSADVNSHIIPETDDTYDLGSSTQEWRNLYLDGTANIDSLVADTADINAGTIDNTVIGGTTAVSGSFTTATATTGNITTVNATTVDTTNLEVTNLKAKDGTAAGSIADTTGVVTLASSVLTTTDINGGTIDGTNITVGAGKTLDVSAGTLTLADNQISGDKVEGGTIAATTITTLASTTVDTTNLEVTNLKAKDGTSAGSIADTTGVVTLASSVLTTTDINGGTIDGTVIGGTAAAAGSFTTVSATGNITVGGTVDGRDVATDGTKLDGIEAGADVTDTTNVTAAGALMDSELTSEASVKALNQGVATTDSPTFAGITATTADINGGTIDGTIIGGTTTAAISGTTGTFSGDVTGSNLAVTDWNTAYSWGNHASAGYLTATNNLSDLNDAATARSNLGLVIGTDVQAYDATIVVDADIGVTVQGYDADTAKTDVAQTYTASQRGTVTTDNDLSFDMSATNFFKCTPSSTGTLTFTNITAGQSGNIWLDNSAAVVISAAATTYISAADLTKINSAGVYFLSYYSDGTNVMVSASSALTSAGA